MTYPTDEETFDERVSPEFTRDDHLNLIQSLLKRIQDFLGYGGRLHDKSGFVMPVGTIVPYTGLTRPSGWLLCDGNAYNGSTELNQDLYAVIGTRYGTVGPPFFNVPDLRGMFLRGWTNIPIKSFTPDKVDIDADTIHIAEALYNRTGFPVRFTTDDTLPAPFLINTTYYLKQATGIDLEFSTTKQNAFDGVVINITTIGAGTSYIHPYNEEDRDSRTVLEPGGSSGADLGSFQDDALQGHYHGLLNGRSVIRFMSGGETKDCKGTASDDWVWHMYVEGPITDGVHGIPRVSIETRPRNVYVNYIIKR